ncbi:MAG: hypothetical protein IPL61_29115 [Myxococcales bacterium]|nr:hypothetical protein [Myxococcales bacterium]
MRRHSVRGLTVDQLHGAEDALGEAAGVVDRAHVGVRHAGHGLGLGDQPLAALPGEVAHQLQRDPTIELGIVGGVDVAHPALAQQIDHDVAADHRAAIHPRQPTSARARRRRGHRRGRRRVAVAQLIDGRVDLRGRER